jgi:hypothetical protein
MFCSDLTSGKGSEFKLRVTAEEEEEVEEGNSYFNSDQLLLHSRPAECVGFDGEGDNNDADIGDTPFETLASKMIDVVHGGKLKKRVCIHIILFITLFNILYL